MNLKHYKQLDRLIHRENTGSAVKLSKSMGVSERSLKRMIALFKHECSAPVKYDRQKNTYYYTVKRNCQFECGISTILYCAAFFSQDNSCTYCCRRRSNLWYGQVGS